MKLYRDLSAEEIIEFQKWARGNYRPLGPIDGTWHPVVQRECVLINEEFDVNLGEDREAFLSTHLRDNKADLL